MLLLVEAMNFEEDNMTTCVGVTAPSPPPGTYVRAMSPYSAAPCLFKCFHNESFAVLSVCINRVSSSISFIFH